MESCNHAVFGVLWMTFTLPVSKDYPYCSLCQDLISFYCQIVLHCMDIPHLIYPCIAWVVFAFWTVWIMLLWTLVCSFCVDVRFYLSWVYTLEWNCWITQQLLGLIFWVIARSFSKVTVPFYIPPESSVGEESTCSVGDPSSIPGSGRPIGEGIGYSFQYSGLENSMDCIVHGVAKSRTRLSDFHFQESYEISNFSTSLSNGQNFSLLEN